MTSIPPDDGAADDLSSDYAELFGERLSRDIHEAAGPIEPLTGLSVAELLDSTPVFVDWFAAGLLAPDAITLLTGAPKLSGKTTFALSLIAAMLREEPFLLARTRRPEHVAYLGEMSRSATRRYLESAGIARDAPFTYYEAKEVRRVGLPGALEQVIAAGADLVCVDTFASLAGLTGDAENNAGSVTEAVQPLRDAVDANHGVGVLLLHHDRKSGGDTISAGRGSGALPANCDIVLNILRPETNVATVRKLSGEGRFDGIPPELYIERTPDGRFVSHGDDGAIRAKAARDAVLALLAGGELTLKEVEKGTRLARTTLQRAIDELHAGGKIEERGTGKRGDPKRYALFGSTAEMDSAHPGISLGQKPSGGSPDLTTNSAHLGISLGQKPSGGSPDLTTNPSQQGIPAGQDGGDARSVTPSGGEPIPDPNFLSAQAFSLGLGRNQLPGGKTTFHAADVDGEGR